MRRAGGCDKQGLGAIPGPTSAFMHGPHTPCSSTTTLRAFILRACVTPRPSAPPDRSMGPSMAVMQEEGWTRATQVKLRCTCAVLCCAVLCCAVLCCAVLCCAVLCRAVPCHAMPCKSTAPAVRGLTSLPAAASGSEPSVLLPWPPHSRSHSDTLLPLSSPMRPLLAPRGL